MDALEELQNQKDLSATKIRKAYISYFVQEIEEIDEKLKDETLSEKDRKKLTNERNNDEKIVRETYSLETPTDEEVAKYKAELMTLLSEKYDDKILASDLEASTQELAVAKKEYQDQQEELKKAEEQLKKVAGLKDFQEFLQLHFKALDYKKQREIGLEKDKEIKDFIEKLATAYPEICGLDKMPKDTTDYNILKHQSLALNREISNGKANDEIKAVSDNLTKFIASCDEVISKSIKEEELDFEKNKEGLLIQIANEASEIGTLAELNDKIAAIAEEIKDIEAVLIVNTNGASKEEVEKNKTLLEAKKAELKVYQNEYKFRNLPAELRMNNAIFKMTMDDRRAKLENLQEPEKSKKAQELKQLEVLHEDLYEQDFTKELLDKIAKIKANQEKCNQKIEAANQKIAMAKKKNDYITDSKKVIEDYDKANEKLNVVDNLDVLREKAVEEFKGKDFTEEELRNFLESQEEYNVIKGTSDEKENEDVLVKDITDACKKQKVGKVHKDLKTYAKAVGIVTAGLATGLVLSSVPGVGTVRMGLATAKLVGNAIDKGINIYNSKHQDKKPIKTISQVIDEKIIKKLPPKIQKGLQTIEKKLKSKNANLFINGLSAGYIAGNVIEMVTGKTVIQNVADKFNHAKSVSNGASSVAASSQSQSASKGTTPASNPSNGNTTGTGAGAGSGAVSGNGVTDAASTVLTPTEMMDSLHVGDVYDLSNIPKGYVASGSKDAVSLITSAGKSSTLAGVVEKDGEIWCRFLQETTNEAGKQLEYAWIKGSDVLNSGVLKEAVGKGLGR